MIRKSGIRFSEKIMLKTKNLAEARDHVVRYGTRTDFLRIVLVAHRPDPRLAADHRNFAAAQDLVLDIEARAPEFGDAGGDLDAVAEAHGLAVIEPHVDQRQNAEDVEEVLPVDPEGRFEQRPGAVVEIFEQVLGRHHAGRIAMAEFNGHLPAEDKSRQWSFLTLGTRMRAWPRPAVPRGTFLANFVGKETLADWRF